VLLGFSSRIFLYYIFCSWWTIQVIILILMQIICHKLAHWHWMHPNFGSNGIPADAGMPVRLWTIVTGISFALLKFCHCEPLKLWGRGEKMSTSITSLFMSLDSKDSLAWTLANNIVMQKCSRTIFSFFVFSAHGGWEKCQRGSWKLRWFRILWNSYPSTGEMIDHPLSISLKEVELDVLSNWQFSSLSSLS